MLVGIYVFAMPMNRALPVIAGLKLLPDRLHVDLLTTAVNHLMRGQEIEEQLDYLEGKRVCLAIDDTGNRFHLRISGRRLHRCSAHLPWDVRISGKLVDFWRLANRSEDPDTLFFNRDLKLEGDTDAALYIKNLLDALEFDLDRHLQEVVGPAWAPRIKELIERVERSALAERMQRLVQA